MRCCLLHLPAAFFISAYSAVTYYHIENDYSVKLTRKVVVCHSKKQSFVQVIPFIVENIYILSKILSSMYFLPKLC